MRSFTHRARTGFALALFAALSTAAPAPGGVVYTILDLGTLGGSDSRTAGYNVVNASGQVVGDSHTAADSAYPASRTAASAPIVPGAGGSDLGTLGGTTSQANSINASGQAVGYASTTGDAAQRAFRTAANGPIVPGAGGSDLGTLG